MSDVFMNSINGRRREVREQFATNFGAIIDEKGLKQSDVITRVNAIWAKNGVLKNSEDPNSGVRVLQAWELSRWARAAVTPEPAIITVIAEALEVTPSDLVSGILGGDGSDHFSIKQNDGNSFTVDYHGTVDRRRLSLILQALDD